MADDEEDDDGFGTTVIENSKDSDEDED